MFGICIWDNEIFIFLLDAAGGVKGLQMGTECNCSSNAPGTRAYIRARAIKSALPAIMPCG